MRFICLGYLDESSWEGKSEDERRRFMNECFEYHNELHRRGHVLGGEALDSSRNTVTLRLKDGSVDLKDGPYAETKEVLAGFSVLEASTGSSRPTMTHSNGCFSLATLQRPAIPISFAMWEH